jgi:Lar family restriction alleviation protein
MNKKILPCPFCGSDDVALGYKPHPKEPDKYHGVSCLSCAATCGFHTSKENAIERWNSRASSEREILERITELGSSFKSYIDEALKTVKITSYDTVPTPVLESIGESEVRLYVGDGAYKYLVYVGHGHARAFAGAVNLAIENKLNSLK